MELARFRTFLDNEIINATIFGLSDADLARKQTAIRMKILFSTC